MKGGRQFGRHGLTRRRRSRWSHSTRDARQRRGFSLPRLASNRKCPASFERLKVMYKSANSLKTFLCLLTLVGVAASVRPHAGFGQGDDGPKLNCDDGPCDAGARGRKAFNDRKLNKLGGE